MTGPERGRVAELIVAHPGGRRRGSGYRIAADRVLTAAHVLADAESVVIRFEPGLPGEWTVPATGWSTEPDSDIAYLSIEARRSEKPVTTIHCGRIGDRAAVLAVQAVGFPRWKMRAGEDGLRYRDACHLVGSVPVLSNWREGTLDVVLSSAPAPDATGVSPWEGMSGAALWVGDRIVGVLAKHHPGDGLGRLAAARFVAPDLPDVVPAPPLDPLINAYQEQLADIAPEVLYERDDELAMMVRFCAEDRTYEWWQAGPWAGKSALLSWFALHPAAGVDVVSFFVTSRFAGQSDNDAFTEALIEQLAVLVGERPQAALAARARHGHLLRLLRLAAQRSVAAGRRLLLGVDGLDEDTGGAPSIASLLPRHPPEGVRVLVASRPHPPLPDDVPTDHPLRTVTPRPLSRSRYAGQLALVARNEVTQLLEGSPSHRDVLGLITASGGGLSLRDLEELTGAPPYELTAQLGGVFGRSVRSRGSHGGHLINRADERGYLFGHEVLREIAEEQFGTSLARYRDRLHAWADGYRDRGWPVDTPTYLLRGYRRMLTATGDVARIAACGTDRARLDRMLDLTGGDALALAELAAALELVASRPDPDYVALILLGITRDELIDRNSYIPPRLPAVWVRLGHPTRALAMAEGIGEPGLRAEALAGVALELARTGGRDRAGEVAATAETLVRSVSLGPLRSRALHVLSDALDAMGEADRANAIKNDADDPEERPAPGIERLAEAARHAVRTGSLDRFLAGIDSEFGEFASAVHRANTLTRLADEVVAADRDHALDLAERAERAARHVEPHLSNRADPPTTVARCLAEWGDHVRAERLADPRGGDWTTAGSLAVAAARGGDHDRARRWARRFADPHRQQASALAGLALSMARAGDRELAIELATSAEAAAVDPVETRPETPAADRAEAAARFAVHDPEQYQKMTDRWNASLAIAAALLGNVDRAEALAGSVREPVERVNAVVDVADALAIAGQSDRAVDLCAALITDADVLQPRVRERHLSRVINVLVTIGAIDRASALVDLVDPSIVLSQGQRTASELVEALTVLRRYDQAERVARGMTDRRERAYALAAVAHAVSKAGDPTRAMNLATAAETALREDNDRPRHSGVLASTLFHSDGLTNSDQGHALVRRLIVDALRSGEWQYTLHAVGWVDLPALQRLADELLSQAGEHGR